MNLQARIDRYRERDFQQLEADMRNAAKEMKFEQAAEMRDRLRYLRERELAVR